MARLNCRYILGTSWVILTLCLKCAFADLPIHALYKDMCGLWRFTVAKTATGPGVLCGSGFPNTTAGNLEHTDLEAYLEKHYGVDYQFKLELALFMVPFKTGDHTRGHWNALAVKDENGNIVGSWTAVYDQGFEIRLYDGKALFFYMQYAKIANDEYETIPSRTLLGWITHKDGSGAAVHTCGFGVKERGFVRKERSKVKVGKENTTSGILDRLISNGSFTFSHASAANFSKKLGNYPCHCEAVETRDSNLPHEYKFQHNDLIPVVNQGPCGSCFSIASFYVIQAKLIKQGLKHNVHLGIDPCDFINQGCNGGYPYVLGKLGHEYGLTTAGNLIPAECIPRFDRVASDRVFLSDYGYVGGCYQCTQCNGEEMIMKEIYENGPVVAAIDASILPNQYNDGVIGKDDQEKPPDHAGVCEINNWKLSGWEYTSHAIVLYGWGEEQDANGNIVKFWYARNSWGKDWGQDGNFKIIRGVNYIGIENEAVFLDVDFKRLTVYSKSVNARVHAL